MRNYKLKAIVIKRINIGEADRIVTVFTNYYGKIQIKASGVRKIISRRSPHIELLNYSLLTLYHTKSLPILTEAQVIQDFSEIKEDLTRIGFAYHICELVDGLCPEGQENRKVFSLLYSTLVRLSSSEQPTHFFSERVRCPPDESKSSFRRFTLKSLPSTSSGNNMFSKSDPEDIASIIHDFEIQLLIHLGYFKYSTTNSSFNTISFIEQILERKLKTRQMLHRF